MTAKQWQQAVDAYKQSLLKNPSDDNARYNLAYAQEMLKKQQNKGGGKNKNQKNKDQQNKDNKNKQNQNNDQKKNQQNKDQQNKDQNKDKDQENQHPQPQPSNIDKQRAEQLLNAAAQAEKKLQEDKDKKQKGIPVKGGKDW